MSGSGGRVRNPSSAKGGGERLLNAPQIVITFVITLPKYDEVTLGPKATPHEFVAFLVQNVLPHVRMHVYGWARVGPTWHEGNPMKRNFDVGVATLLLAFHAFLGTT